MINTTVIEKIKELASSKGWEVLDVRKVSDNPLDHYLSFVLCKRGENDYCTHLCNHEDLDRPHFVQGHYDFKTYESASKDFNERA